MYINRKTGELVEAKHDRTFNWWRIYTDDINYASYACSDTYFQSQYGQAMLCPDKSCICYHKNLHTIEDCQKDTKADTKCPSCIPYIPEEQKEGFKPIVTTGRPFTISKDIKPIEQSLMLSDEEIRKYIYYTFQCNHCFIISGHSSRNPADAPVCCNGEQMIPIRHEIESSEVDYNGN